MVTNARRQRGVTFLTLLFAIALAGIALAGTGALWQLESRREKEKELLFVGNEYRKAIGSYASRTPEGSPPFPERLEDLLQDNRYPTPVRHLRRLYRDPMSADGQWEIIREQGRITGVVSRSDATPIKIAGFSKDFESFEGARSYRQWRFVGIAVARTPVAAASTDVVDTTSPSTAAN